MWFSKKFVKCFSRDASDKSDDLDTTRALLEVEAHLLGKLVACDRRVDYSRLTKLVEKSGKDWWLGFLWLSDLWNGCSQETEMRASHDMLICYFKTSIHWPYCYLMRMYQPFKVKENHFALSAIRNWQEQEISHSWN